MELKYKNNVIEFDIKKNGNEFTLDYNNQKTLYKSIKLNDNSFSIEKNGKNFLAFCAENDNHFFVNIDGISFAFDKILEVEKSFELEGGKSSDIDIIKPPMPGAIVKVLVSKDQKVSEGDSLIIIEAMKMETTLYASIDGTVQEVNVEAGEQVDSDKLLIVIKKE